MGTLDVGVPPRRKASTPLLYFLICTFVLFIAILVVCFLITRRSNPVMLDEHGKPVSSNCIYGVGQEETVRAA